MYRLIVLLTVLGLLAFSQASNHERITCFNGTAVYSEDLNTTYESFGIATILCPENYICGQLTWTQFSEEANATIFIESAFCTNKEPDCDVIPLHNGNMSIANCLPYNCSSSYCNNFIGQVCANGAVVYDMTRSYIVADINSSLTVCNRGASCSKFEFNSTFPPQNILRGVEIAMCYDGMSSCQNLTVDPELGMIVNDSCYQSVCSGDFEVCNAFIITPPSNRGLYCDRGSFIYTADSNNSFIDAIDYNNSACNEGDVCARFDFHNTDVYGVTTRVETGVCAPSQYLSLYNCTGVENDPRTNNVTNCTVSFCSGDHCGGFTKFQATTTSDCPERAVEGEVQILPGCTMSQAIDGVFACLEDFIYSLPYNNRSDCAAKIDFEIRCIAAVASRCVEAPVPGCRYDLDEVAGIENILELVANISAQITSYESFQTIINSLTGMNLNLSIIDLFCEPDLQLVMDQLANVNTSFGLGPPFCSDNRVLDDLIVWEVEAAHAFTIGSNNTEAVCLAFDRAKVRAVDAILYRCDFTNIGDALVPTLGYFYSTLAQLAVNIAVQDFLDLEIPGCTAIPFPQHVVCYQGDVAYSLNEPVAVYKYNVTADACYFGEECLNVSWINYNPRNETAYVQYAACVNPQEPFSCQDLLSNDQVSSISNCTFNTCNTSRCNEFKGVECNQVPEDEIALFPRCTLSGTLTGGFSCANIYLEGLPYDNETACRENIRYALNCAIYGMQVCLGGDCPTILDAFVPKSIYSEVLNLINQYQIVSPNGDILEALIPDSNARNLLYSSMCNRNSQTVDIIRILISSLVNNNQTDFGIEQDVCEGPILSDLLDWGIEALEGFVNATDHLQVCDMFTTLTNRLVTAWNTRCNVSQLAAVLVFVPEELIQRGIDTVIDLLNEAQIGNCDGNITAPMLDCNQYYYDYSACGMRRAWLCDYANWKIDFLSNWLQLFTTYVENNGIYGIFPIDTCYDMSGNDLCTNEEETRCLRSARGCRFCYCRDLSYRNPSYVMEVYRRDYSYWRSVLSRYRGVFDQIFGGNSCFVMP